MTYIISTKDEFDPKIKEFECKYAGEMIEFDAYTADVSKNEDYDTRFNYLIHAGDYSTTSVSGPNFQSHDVNYIDLNLVGSDFVTGGIFGPEAGIVATFILLVSIGILLFIDKKGYFQVNL